MPEIHRNIPNEEYQAWDRCSNSRLNHLLKSPAHCRWNIDNPQPKTPALLLGDAVDCLIFAPNSFTTRFSTPGQCEAITLKAQRCSKPGIAKYRLKNSNGQEYFGWFCALHNTPLGFATGISGSNIGEFEKQEITVLSQEEMDRANKIAHAVCSHPMAWTLLDSCDDYQLSITWEDSGLPCKARLDGFSKSLNTIIDLKTTIDASPTSFEKSIFNFGYFRQAAMYFRACEHAGLQVEHFTIIAVEKDAPFNVAVYRLKDEIVELGRKQIVSLLGLYKDCLDSGKWPGYPEDIIEVGIPRWSEKLVEQDLVSGRYA